MFDVLARLKEDGYGDCEVHIRYQYGDYWKTVVAPETENVMVKHVVWSEYHSMHRLVRDEDELAELEDVLGADCDEGYLDRGADMDTVEGRRLAERIPREAVVIG